MSNSHNLISEINKNHLLELIQKTASHVSSGDNPTDALIKAAREFNSPPEFIHRAAEAYNGGAHLVHLKRANEDERGSSIPLADPDEACMQIYSTVFYDPCTPQKVSSDIFSKEISYYFDTTIEEVEEKNASDNVKPITISEALNLSKQLDWEEKVTIKKADELHHDSCVDFARHVGQLKESMRHASPGERRQWAENVAAWRGKSSCDVLSLVVDSPIDVLEKAAATKERIYFRKDIPAVVAMNNLVGEAEQVTQLHYKLAQAQYDHLMNSMERHALLMKLGFDVSKVNPVTLAAKPFTSGIPEGNKGVGLASQQKALDTMIDPDVLAESNTIDQALAMKRLLSEDDVIGQGHSPAEIQQALNEINILAPEAGRYEPMLRAILRRRLEMGQSLEDYELDKLLDLNEKIMKREVPSSTPPV